jgi:hypothetical protein
MKPIRFKECNSTYAKTQSEYAPLPVYKSTDGIATSCWRCSILERIKVLFTGKIWVSVMTFNKPLQPLRVSTNRIKKKDEDRSWVSL